MKNVPSNSLRQAFLSYFSQHGHRITPSAPLVPIHDPTLLFINAGMVPFKDFFLGTASPPASRLTSCQKCLRVSGKHNDLEEVGRTARHHTFFEMLGNFSFGDYFKEEAIVRAWDFIRNHLDLPANRLYVTVFGGADNLPADTQAEQLWARISGLPKDRILRRGMADNFWAMGDSGPCGPCSEIYFDQGQGPISDADFENGRILEIWNNVFMQYNRDKGALLPLQAPCVDTGMGLERLAAVMQGADSNYHTDVFASLLDEIAAQSSQPYRRDGSEAAISMRVVADHARAAVHLMADGIAPGNEGRSYVLRRIMRRAIRHGHKLGWTQPHFAPICAHVVKTMGEAYPELQQAAPLIDKLAQAEEEAFRKTLDLGIKLLGGAIEQAQHSGAGQLPGEVVFKLYDTYGFPKDLTQVIANEAALGIDEEGFAAQMAAQQDRSRSHSQGFDSEVASVYHALDNRLGERPFVGDVDVAACAALPAVQPSSEAPSGKQLRRFGEHALAYPTNIAALLQDGREVDALQAGQSGEVILSSSLFYGESGGQIGDAGALLAPGDVAATVRDTQKPLPSLLVSQIKVERGTLRSGQGVWSILPIQRRAQIRTHHSATHLLHQQLRAVLGAHVTQAGSRVEDQRLTFDFTHFSAVSPAQIRAVEQGVANAVAANAAVQCQQTTLQAARDQGAMALFGEKYGQTVRLVQMGDSLELCGGTHVAHTGEIGACLIVREEAVKSGVRRIEAQAGDALQHTLATWRTQLLTAEQLPAGTLAPSAVDSESSPLLAALVPICKQTSAVPLPSKPATPQGPLAAAQYLRDYRDLLLAMCNVRRPQALALAEAHGAQYPALAALAARLTQLAAQERAQSAASAQSEQALAADLLQQAEKLSKGHLVVATVPALAPPALRSLVDAVRHKLGSAAVALGSVDGEKVHLVLGLTADLAAHNNAKQLLSQVLDHIDGRGGGRADFAQAGGSKPAALPAGLAALALLLRAQLR